MSGGGRVWGRSAFARGGRGECRPVRGSPCMWEGGTCDHGAGGDGARGQCEGGGRVISHTISTHTGGEGMCAWTLSRGWEVASSRGMGWGIIMGMGGCITGGPATRGEVRHHRSATILCSGCIPPNTDGKGMRVWRKEGHAYMSGEVKIHASGGGGAHRWAINARGAMCGAPLTLMPLYPPSPSPPRP